MPNPYQRASSEKRTMRRTLPSKEDTNAGETDVESPDDILAGLPPMEDDFLESVDADDEVDEDEGEEGDDGIESLMEPRRRFQMPDPRPNRRMGSDEDDEDDDLDVMGVLAGASGGRKTEKTVFSAITYYALHEDQDSDTSEPTKVLGRRTPKQLARMIYERSGGLTGTWRITQKGLVKKGARGAEKWETIDVFDLDVGPDGTVAAPVATRREDEDDYAYRRAYDPPTPPPAPAFPTPTTDYPGSDIVAMQMQQMRQTEELLREIREQRLLRSNRDGNVSSADSIKEWLTILGPLAGGLVAGLKSLTSSSWEGIAKGIELAQKSSTPGLTEIVSAAVLPILAGGGRSIGDAISNPAGSQPRGLPGPPTPGLPSPAPQPQRPQPATTPQPAAAQPKEPGPVALIKGIGRAFMGDNQRLTAELYWANMAYAHLSDADLQQFIDGGPDRAQKALAKYCPDLPSALVEKSREWFGNVFLLLDQLRGAPPSAEYEDDEPAIRSVNNERHGPQSPAGGNAPPEEEE